MKNRVNTKKIVTAVIAGLCAWSCQVSALDHRDALFNCKVFSKDANGTNYYLRESHASGLTGKMEYTTDSSLATKFTFARSDTWKHDSGGTAYYLAAAPTGNCIGITSSSTDTPTIGDLVTSNWSCTDSSYKKVVLESIDTTKFAMRVQATSYWFTGWGGVASGHQIRLDTRHPGANYQEFYTSGCRTGSYQSMRPKTGT